MPRIASTTFNGPYSCQYDWPEDCRVQAGGKGMVFRKGTLRDILEKTIADSPTLQTITNGMYTTAFFEAFPRNPNTFIRGEGPTMVDAEKKAWDKYQRILQCSLDHTDLSNFDRKGYKNGAAFCKECNLFLGECFEPLEHCCQCGVATCFGRDNQNRFWCEQCNSQMPRDLWPRWRIEAEEEDGFIF
jgi:hypothetical protein